MTSTFHTAAPHAGGDLISNWSEDPLLHITRICLGFLQGLFAKAPRGHYQWNVNTQETEIIITDESPLAIDVINARPAIISVLSQVAFAGIALDNLQALDIRTDTHTFTDMISGHISFNCISSNQTEARHIAWLVARHCWALKHMMLVSGFHEFGIRAQIMPPSPPGAIIAGDVGPEITSSVAVIPFRFQWQDKVGPSDAQLLGSIEAHVELIAGKILQPTQVSVGGTPGPGLLGSELGARATGVRPFRGPVIAGRELRDVVITELPDSQKPADPPLQGTIKT